MHRLFSWLGCFFVAVALAIGFLVLSGPSLAKTTATLPALYRRAKPVVMVFHAQWCSGCKQMRPFEATIESDTQGKLHWTYVDVDTSLGEGLSRRFNIQSTPSYVLFNQNGTVAFRHTGQVSPSLLRLQTHKLAGLAKARPVPNPLMDSAISHYQPKKPPRFHLVRIVADRCERTNCQFDSRKFAFFQQQLKLWPAPIAFTQLDAATAKPYLEKITSPNKGYDPETGLYYVLLDEDGIPLVRSNKALDDHTLKIMGSAIQLVMVGTL